ncbi:MAG: NYN domain-containing protein [Euryarchaeota archaeon]|nr:NYN domain-containing protein [Euryarchaeota archaeon]
MVEKRIDDRQLAFLVDGDNASATLIEDMLAEASKYGSVIIRRVYGNWTGGGQVNNWKAKLKEYALTPYQQFPNISNRHITKNATDIALIIDAMDILHDGIVQGFVIVSSDSDYTSLAIKIREHGLFVIGIGRKDTNDSFRRACDVFVSTENLGKDQDELDEEEKAKDRPRSQRKQRPVRDALELLNRAFDSAVNDDGRALNGDIGAALRRLDPGFDTRTYGKPSLLNLIEDLDDVFEVERYDRGVIYVQRRGEKKESIDTKRTSSSPDCIPTMSPEDALPLINRAYELADKTSDGWVDTFRLFRAARRIDSSFDSSFYGKEKISHLLEALPSYFTLNRRGKSMMVRPTAWAEEEIMQPPEVIESVSEKKSSDPAPHETQLELRPMEVVRLATKAFETAVKDDGKAFLPQMSKELKRIAPEINFKSMGKSGLREFLEEYPDIFILHKKGRNVYVSRRKGRRPARPISELIQ